MSEKVVSHETHEKLTKADHEQLRANARPEKHHIRNSSQEKAHDAREAIKHETEAQQNPLERLKAAEEAAQPVVNQDVNRELREITLRRELKHIRRKLPAPQRALSKVIHQPAVRVTSEFAGKTVSRPSGLLGGGVVALTGTTLYLYLANHIGFTYNYGVFLLLFVVGFAIGLVVELVVNLVFRSRHKARS